MRLAIKEALVGAKKGQYHIGAVVVIDDKVISLAHPTLEKTGDPSAHAEVNVIRAAVKKLKSKNPNGTWQNLLNKAWLYSTMEQCAMCTSLAVWSNVQGIVYGNTFSDLLKSQNARKNKFHYIYIDTEDIIKKSNPKPRLFKGFLKEECAELLKLVNR